MVLTRTRHDKVTGVGCIYFDSNATIDKENIFAPSTGPWITAFLAATLCTNVISTCERPYLGLHHAPTDSSAASVSHLLPPFFLSRLALLAFRIWYVGKRVRRMSAHTSVLRPVLRVVLDAGVLYSVSLLAALLCFVAKNRGHYVLIDMVRGILLPFVVVLGLIIGYHPSFTSFLPGSCHFYRIVWHHRSVVALYRCLALRPPTTEQIMPIISITFYMVIIRITISKTNSQGIMQATSSGSGALTLSRMSRLAGEREYPMKRMEVHITQLTETNERGSGSGSGSGEIRGDSEKEEDGDMDDARKVLGGFAV